MSVSVLIEKPDEVQHGKCAPTIETGIATAGMIVARTRAQEDVDHEDHEQRGLEDRPRDIGDRLAG